MSNHEKLAQLAYRGFAAYDDEFGAITRRHGQRFADRDWIGNHADAAQRIDLYDIHVNQTLGELIPWNPDRVVWHQARDHLAGLLGDSIDRELAKTFFNSMSRRYFRTTGVDSQVEFVDQRLHPTEHVRDRPGIRDFRFDGGLGAMIRRLLESLALEAHWHDLGGCAAYVHRELRRQLVEYGGTGALESVEIVKPLFYRNQRAFVVGRLRTTTSRTLPLVIGLRHPPAGIEVERVLTTEDPISILFSYSRSYFHVDLKTVGDTVAFLSDLLPSKPVDEIYASLGRAKQAKTERIRSVIAHLTDEQDQFVVAPGTPGMVMMVFTLQRFDVVFKVIRDRFAPPKTVTHKQVKEKYRFVQHHDRAGRLIDAQEFRRLVLPVERFCHDLLCELTAACGDRVRIEDDHVVIDHCYIERRITPLNLALNAADDTLRSILVDDYAQAIRELAETNVFPGDLLLKNFGVSRHNRVIFYDFDEVCPLTDCRFRRLPPPRDDFEAMSSDHWFNVGPDDVFPEQFPSFLGLSDEALDRFRRHNGDLLDPRFWAALVERFENGEVIDTAPYARVRRG